VPYDDQQFRALMAETQGVLAVTDGEQRQLAERISEALEAPSDDVT
jgi:hypothetical protein